ncbi:MAG: hypothetical protein LZ173_05350 [Thaumarchaeota archaeon]|jgi:chemotaxis receptor (MCP) glutamine deamidase CheD|nr:hypothetical protein [Candidatus Geocrenenecus arthurdayi]
MIKAHVEKRRNQCHARVKLNVRGSTVVFLHIIYCYSVTVYDAADKIGGMLRLSIPEFRLPSHIVEDEVYKNEAW